MTRIAAFIAGLLLFVCPGWWLLDFSHIDSKYQKVSSDVFLFIGLALLATYGSVFFGVAVSWVRANRNGQPLLPNEVFMAGMFGVLAACVFYFVGGGIYSFATYGAFDKAIGGNLWGLLAIFWGVLGALISAGIALLFYAWRGPAGSPSRGPWSSPPTISP